MGRIAARSLAIVALGATACTAVAPAPSSIMPSVSPAGSVSGSASASPFESAQQQPSPTPRPGALDLAVDSLDPAWVQPMLEFASDGDSVIFSSGVADGPAGEFAPDLWRYTPGAERPELLWGNPRRDRSLVRISGDRSLWAFVEMPLDGARAWDLWLLTEPGGQARLLDTHPGDEDMPSLVPSFVVHEEQIAWTAFDRGPAGPVSRLLYAAAPDWEPRVVMERPAREAELWFPSLRGTLLAYTEVVYSADRLTDERHVYLMEVTDPTSEPIRLDTSGRATMPLLVDGGVVWKEADPGFSMFNWGRLYFYDLQSGEVSPISMRPQEYVNYPSAGYRFVAGWGADAFTFTIHDLELDVSRVVTRYQPETHQSVFRAHVAGSLLAWVYTTVTDAPPGDAPTPDVTEIRYAFLPSAGTDRDR